MNKYLGWLACAAMGCGGGDVSSGPASSVDTNTTLPGSAVTDAAPTTSASPPGADAGGGAGGEAGATNDGGGLPGSGDAGGADSGGGGPVTVTRSPGCGKSGQAGSQLLTLDVSGTKRTYLLTLPAGYSSTAPQALYFVLHGRDADHTAVTGYGLQSDAIGIFPDGLNRNGTIGWDTTPGGNDVAMFDAVLKSVEGSYCVDESRVYTTGFSWGATMANGLGCMRAGVVRAFASVEGGTFNSASDCKGPVAGWINQYKQDPTVSYATGSQSLSFYLALDSASKPVPYDAPNPCVSYSGVKPVVWCTPDGAIHGWPPYATASIKRFFNSL